VGPSFGKDFPAFLNFAFDSKDLMTVWFLGHPILENTLNRTPYTALNSRIQVKEKLQPIFEQQRFTELVKQAFTQAGTTQQLLADSGIELIRMGSKGKISVASLVIQNSLLIATDKKLNHLPDEVVLESIQLMQ